HLALLRERMLDDLQAILERDDAPYNFNTGNVQQDPPPFPPYLFRDVLLNDAVVAVTKAMLGPGLKNSFYSGNTALPGGQKQPVHPDVGQLWPGLEAATPPFGFVVNVPLVDMTPANGSTELWPGTHLDTTVCVQDGDIKVPEAALARRRETRAPVQPSVRCGSALIRDNRLWHRGMPNLTETPRPMIAMIHWISWWSSAEPVPFPKGTEEFFRHPDLTTNAVFVDGPIDYVRHNQAYDFKK
ncbi:MAG TPA: phytanoyl-CoA dioxygenase family protein, partial [Armatimonadota bacterium]|nr:phytanoyl-CoA dioxygenase family protein [Armatimonadota bacterium]